MSETAKKLDHNAAFMDDMARSILHSLGQAIFLVDASGKVVPPVNEFSEKIFTFDIEGKSLFESLYRNITKDSVAYSQINTVLSTVFGEDDIQWDLMLDHLPTKIVYNPLEDKAPPNSNFNKTLSVTYSPLWDEDDLLEYIVVTAKDVTLEEKKKVAVKKNETELNTDIDIVQELAQNSATDLEEYFGSTYALLDDCQDRLKKIHLKKENFNVLFRNLHTIKGNSHIYGFSYMSNVVHKIETAVTDIKNQQTLASLKSEEIMKLEDGINKIQTEVQRYNRLAKKIFHISNQFDLKMINKLNRYAIQMDIIFSKIFTKISINWNDINDKEQVERIYKDLYSNNQNYDYIFAMQRVLNGVKKVGQNLDVPEIIDYARVFSSTISEIACGNQLSRKQIETGLILAHRNLVERAKQLYVSSDLPTWYDGNVTVWTPLFYGTFNMMKCFQNLFESEHENEEKRAVAEIALINSVEDLLVDSSQSNILYFRATAKQLYAMIKEENPEKNKNSIFLTIKELWKYVSTVSLLNTAFRASKEMRESFNQIISSFESSKVNKDQIKDTAETSQNLLFTTFEWISNSGHHPFEFLSESASVIYEKDFNVNDNEKQLQESIDLFIWPEEKPPTLEGYFSKLKTTHSLDEILSYFKDEATKSKLASIIYRFLTHNGHNLFYLKVIDLVYLLEIYIENESTIRKRQISQTKSVMSFNIDRLANSIKLLDKGDLHLARRRIGKAFECLLNVPVKPSLLRFCSSVDETSEKLGKKVNFRIYGDDITLSKDRLSELSDCITHILRNSIDHGVEDPETRKKFGKSEVAILEIECREDDNEINLIIRDDGRGINADEVGKRAVRMGKLTENELQMMTEEEKILLIFLPTLSTKNDISSISGRGIGMDVVKDNVERIGGRIEVISERGKGTTMKITLSI